MFESGAGLATDRWRPTSIDTGDAVAFAASGERVFALMYDDGVSGVYQSADAGASWQRMNDGLPPALHVTAMMACAHGLFVGTVARGIYHTEGDGQRWRTAGAGLPADTTLFAFAERGSTLFAATEGAGVFRSADGGAYWTAANLGLPLDGEHLSVVALAATPSSLFASHPLGLHRSRDDGGHWEAVNTGLPAGTMLLSLHAAQEGDLYACSPHWLYHSADDGATWFALDTSFVGPGLIRALASREGALFIGTQGASDSMVYCSTNEGATWEALRAGLPQPAWSMNLHVAGGHLLVGVGEQGIWRRSLAAYETPAARKEGGAGGFMLEQNEPNPFEQVTSIPYTLQTAALVTLEVQDVRGRRVATLLDEHVGAGAHRVLFNASSLSGGVYAYRLTMGGVSQTRHMLLLK